MCLAELGATYVSRLLIRSFKQSVLTNRLIKKIQHHKINFVLDFTSHDAQRRFVLYFTDASLCLLDVLCVRVRLFCSVYGIVFDFTGGAE